MDKITRLYHSNQTFFLIVSFEDYSGLKLLNFVSMLRDITYFWRISRPGNVLISWVTFCVACFIARGKSLDFFQDGAFWGTGLTIIGIAATGYWINDVYDFRIDRINKPGRAIVNALLSVKKVITVYIIINIGIVLLSGIYLGWDIGLPGITFINLLSISLLIVYASWLKRIGVAGNLVISFLTALVVILGGYLYGVNIALIWAIIFAFEITLIREITKDVEDIPGDLQFQLKTLPIQIGIVHTKKILYVLYGVFILSCSLPFVYNFIRFGEYLWTYEILSILIVQLPSILIIRRVVKSQKPGDFSLQSKYLKYLMVGGILTLFFL